MAIVTWEIHMANKSKRELELEAELQKLREAQSAPAPATAPAGNAIEVKGLGALELVAEPETTRRSSAGAKWSPQPNSIPMGQALKLPVTGTCDVEGHKAIGTAYEVYLTGICGDFDGQRKHKGCAQPCGMRTFKYVGCRECATKARKTAERDA